MHLGSFPKLSLSILIDSAFIGDDLNLDIVDKMVDEKEEAKSSDAEKLVEKDNEINELQFQVNMVKLTTEFQIGR